MKKRIKILLIIPVLLLLAAVVTYVLNVRMSSPLAEGQEKDYIRVQEIGENHFGTSDGSWLRKNDKGVWELYVHGEPYARGLAFGALAQRLLAEKESSFISEIENRVPSSSYLNFLKYVVGWFHRDLDEYVPDEYLKEIYGSSQYMADSFDYISPKYHRGLSYHAAHDIGHALQNMNLVGCTSFVVKGDKSENGKLLIGRNFDFYFGEEFAKDRMVAFYNPDQGYQFMSVTWACFSGVVSGINEKGLTVTLNSAKSAIPSKGKTPVSIIARQILQYASTIDEAYAIAKSYDSFVAETFLIGSKKDRRAALIEKTPEVTVLYEEDDSEMIVTNHFQSDELKNDPLNQDYLQEGVSDYRYERVHQLIDSLEPLTPTRAVHLLRDKKGLDGEDIGLANEKAVNQLIAHHSVIFSPEEMIVWVSAPPYQLGEYVAYDLNEIFKTSEGDFFTYTDSLSIAADPFLDSQGYRRYTSFVNIKDRIQKYLAKGEGTKLQEKEIDGFIKSNPKGFLTYYYLGDYFKSIGSWQEAEKYYNIALDLEIAKQSERKHIEEGLKECMQHL
ncbi:C45 family peptidase [Fulvivirga ulvae]|uniref:C45 family autoproteolytic acyltransferase/hydolase n=1 Tax=Fulvivirga ulvae TaxID=2904245 RepID=UPI001F3BD229|nr:C45 family peptidase [Fulvivirga ulvae]UII34802.1 C45 family peptidase [Fulvivirga ulvae]